MKSYDVELDPALSINGMEDLCRIIMLDLPLRADVDPATFYLGTKLVDGHALTYDGEGQLVRSFERVFEGELVFGEGNQRKVYALRATPVEQIAHPVFDTLTFQEQSAEDPVLFQHIRASIDHFFGR